MSCTRFTQWSCYQYIAVNLYFRNNCQYFWKNFELEFVGNILNYFFG